MVMTCFFGFAMCCTPDQVPGSFSKNSATVVFGTGFTGGADGCPRVAGPAGLAAKAGAASATRAEATRVKRMDGELKARTVSGSFLKSGGEVKATPGSVLAYRLSKGRENGKQKAPR